MVLTSEDRMPKLKINGEEKDYTDDEFAKLVEDVQKGTSAQQKWEEAAKIREEAAKAAASAKQYQDANAQMVAAIQKAQKGDADAYTFMMKAAGLEGETLQDSVDAYKEAWEEVRAAQEEQPVRRGQQQVERPAAPKPIGLDGLEPDVKQFLLELAQERREQNKTRIFDETVKDLDKYPRLSKIISKGGPRAAKLQELAKEKVKGRIRDGETYDAELRAKVAAELLETVSVFGGDGDGTIPSPGLGASPGISHTDTHASTPPKMPSLDSPAFEAELGKLLSYEVHKDSGE